MEFNEVLNWLISLLTLSFLEIVLGIDNLVFISILSERLKPELRRRVRRMGLALALVTRLLLLASLLWLTGLTKPVFSLWDHGFSIRDLILFAGGLFLLVKATQEIHADANESTEEPTLRKFNNPWLASVQIAVLDIVFSIDSVITAVGMTQHFPVMATAIVIAIIFMIWFSDTMSEFINTHPSVKVLALSFLILIGTVLIADSFGFHVPRGYIYFAISFALFVEAINTLVRRQKNKKKHKSH